MNLEEIAVTQAELAQPGDMLIITFDGLLTAQQAQQIRERLAAIAPGLHTLMFDGNTKVTIQKAEAE